MEKLRVIQDGETLPIPDWADALIRLGRFMARGGEGQPQIAAVCLPAADYAALFTALGAFLALGYDSEAKYTAELARLQAMLGAPVTYLRNDRTFIGKLEAIDQEKKTARITILRGGGRHERFEVPETRWHQINPTNLMVNLAHGATRRQIHHAQDLASHAIAIASVFGPRLSDAVTQAFRPYAALYVRKVRFEAECETLKFSTGRNTISAKDTLNYAAQREGTAAVYRSSAAELEGLNVGCVVIEATHRLGDQLASLGEMRAVVIMARNSSVYREAATHMLSSANRRGEATPPKFGNVPSYMKVLYIQ